ncbi:MAG: sulfatase-like hydrolase/transferase [Planctomycetes bacterium]|nr:sulfatase-like hydrolase/transferase [Planctomycetota bacterium]
MSRLLAALAWLGALALLHVASLAPLPFAGGDVAAVLARWSPDLAALLALAVLGAALGRPRWFAHAAAALLLVGALHRTAAFYVQLLLERRLDLRFDLQELPGVVHLLTHDAWPVWAVAAVAVVVLVAVQLLLAWAFARVAAPARRGRGALWLAFALQATVAVAVLRGSADSAAPSPWHRSALLALADDLHAAVRYWRDPHAFDDPIRADIGVAAAALAAAPTDLGRLEGADLHVLFVESYGRFAHRSPAVLEPLRALWREAGPSLQAAGIAVCTAICAPSNTGGESWLAHAQLLTGARIGSRRAWQLLLESPLQPLPHRFRQAGYRTVEVMPAMPRHWPEGARFYGFDEAVTQLELGYRGTRYHWGLMPDQFALHHLLRQVVEPATQPLFTMYVSVTSHAPFTRVPPYVADWRIDADTFAGPPRTEHPVTWFDVPNGPRLPAAYADTIEYSMRCVLGFVERLPRPSIVVVLGDHQPPLAGVADDPATAFHVPIHVITNRPQLLDPVRAIGFVDGWEAPADAGVFSTVDFAARLLQLYAR